MAAGCFSIITALSIMNGFEQLIRHKLRGFEGDLRISGAYDENKLNDLEDILKLLLLLKEKLLWGIQMYLVF